MLDLVETRLDRARDRIGAETMGHRLLADLVRGGDGRRELGDGVGRAPGIMRRAATGHDLDEVRPP